ncbi:glycosyltransferase family 9 protein [Acetobacteraceae bacterium]|nr:glycosyltransferase family 9 protein [Acetobacteraceae bacterium]
MTPNVSKPKILIIKHGAFGDFIQSFPSFEAIRKTCPMAHITLLCDPSLKEIAALSPYFDEILTDQRERLGFSLSKWRCLQKRLKIISQYALVIDLQQSLRSQIYLSFSGHAKKRDILKKLGKKTPLHALIRQAKYLQELHIPPLAPQKANWLIEAGKIQLPQNPRGPYIVLCAETSEKHRYKSWPLQNFIQLAFLLAKEGFQPILTGKKAAPLKSQERLAKLNILDLRGKTTIPDLAKIMSQADLCIGADTGSMHLATFCGCPTLVLFSTFSDPRFHSPIPLKAGDVTTLQARDTASLSFRKVLESALHLLKKLG